MKKVTFLIITLFVIQLSYSQNDWVWSNHLQSTGDVFKGSNPVLDIQVDADNNVYHCGLYDNADLNVQGTILLNENRWDAYIMKFDPAGNLLWSNRMYSSHNDEAAAIVVVDDFVYVAGSFRNNDISFDEAGTITILNDGDYDSYLAKYDLDGNLLKATHIFRGTGLQRIKDMTYDPYSKELVFTGFFKTNIQYNDGGGLISPISTAEGGKDMFFAKADTSGVINSFSSAFTLVDNNGTVLKDINMSPDTSYYLTGDLYDTLVFPGTPNDTVFGDATRNSNALILKLNKDLNLVWARTGGGIGFDHANSATSDGFGNVYAAGKVEGTVRFDSTATLQTSDITGRAASDLYLCKYNTGGNLLWIIRKGGDGLDDAFGLDLSENLVQFCGNFEDTLIINNDTLIAAPADSINSGFAIFDLDGNEIGGQSIGGSGVDIGRAIKFDNNGSTIISGYFESPILSIGDSAFSNSSAPSRDGFIASYYYPFKANISQTAEVLCNGDTTGRLIATTYFGQGPYNYVWSGNTNRSNDSLAYDLSAGTYSVTITDSRDSVAVAQFTINEPSAISVTLDSTNLSCYQSGDGAIATTVAGGTGSYNFSWTGPTGIVPTAEDQSGLSAGKCLVTVTDENGCSVKDSTTVTQPFQLSSTAVVQEENPGMSDGAIDLTVAGGTSPYNYSWTYESAPIGGNTNILTGLQEGIYDVHVEDANMCGYDTTITVPGVTLRVTLIGTDVLCKDADDGSIHAIISSGYDAGQTYSYEFQDESKTPIYNGPDTSVSNLTPGWYYVTLTESPSMETAIDSVEIFEPDSIQVTLTPDTANCYGGLTNITVTTLGGIPDYSFLWSNDATTQSLAGVAAGKYILTVTDANGCEIVDSATTTQPDSLGVTIIERTPISCYGYVDGQLEAQVSGGVEPYTYQWDDNGSQTSYIATLLSEGIYSVNVVDDNGCVRNSSFNFTSPPVLELDYLDTFNISCVGLNDGIFGIHMQGGTPNPTNGRYSYVWSPIGTAADTNYATGLFPLQYTVTVSDYRGCGDSVYTFTPKAPSTALTVSEDVGEHVDNVCFDGTIGSFTALANGGWGNYEYSINQADWQSSSIFSDLAAGNYTVSVRDGGLCIETEDVVIDQPEQLVIQAATAVGNSIQVAAVGGTPPYEYSLDNDTWQVSNTFSDLNPGDYTVYLTDANSCGPDSSDVSIITSLEEIESAVAKIYPNPTQGNVYVEFNTPIDGEFIVEVFSLTGMRVFEETKFVYSGKNQPVKIDLNEHSKGIYLLKINGIVLTTKIILE